MGEMIYEPVIIGPYLAALWVLIMAVLYGLHHVGWKEMSREEKEDKK